ncbi:MAG TPA: hypothetical protein VMQ44_03260 [Candidatus Saccharimonadales bacterium]|nr:hypothetical protein [Candidatus Saccharimonadales bacterium]
MDNYSTSLKKILHRDYFAKSPNLFWRTFFQKRKLNKLAKFFSYLLFVLVIASLVCDFGRSRASSLVLGVDDITGGYSEFNKIDNISGTSLALQKGNLGSWTNGDTSVLNAPDTAYLPEMQYGPNNTLYLLPGSGAGTFKRYWIEEHRWEDLAPLPFSNFRKLSFDGSQYFYTIASTGHNFYRFDCFNNVWQKLPDTPDELGNGANVEFVNKNGGEVFAFRGGSSGYFWLYNAVSNSWTVLPGGGVPLINTGSGMIWDRGDYLYVIRGNNAYHLYRYQISTGSWVDRGYFSPSIVDGAGSKMIFLDTNDFLVMTAGGRLSKYSALSNTFSNISYPTGLSPSQYLMAGAYDGSSKFYAYVGGYLYSEAGMRIYDFSNGKWDNGQMTVQNPYSTDTAWAFDGTNSLYEINNDSAYQLNVATGVGAGISPPIVALATYPTAVYSGGKVYVTRGSGYNDFYSYTAGSGTWNPELSLIPATVATGSSLVDGGDGYLYLTQGGSTAFYRYQISSNIWSTVASVPFMVSGSGGIVKVGSTIYAISGSSNSGRIAIFNLGAQTWAEDLAAVGPDGWPSGARLASDGTSTVYFVPGQNATLTDYQRRFYSYNVVSKAWTRLVDVPDYARGQSIPYLFYRQGSLFLNVGYADNRIYRWDPTTAVYQTDGTWFSKHYDLTQVSAFSQFTYSSGGTGTATVSTRTSDNGAAWDAWTPISGNVVMSTPRRYFQFKVRLQGDGTATPTAANFSLTYSQETTPPSLPSEFHAYDQSGGQELVSGATYTYHHPYFTWNGASDGIGGSGVAGYYVYFGTDSNADPAVSGNYQTATNYTADTPMTAGDIDYLKIKVKDKLGNISSSGAPFFSYRYWFVSPPTSISVSSNADFNQGTGQAIDMTNGSGGATLITQPTGSWANGDLAKLPAVFKGGAAAYANGSIYVLMGNGTSLFYRYDLDANQWASLLGAPTASSGSTSGSLLSYDGSDTIYYITGSGSTAFAKYSISRNTWTSLGMLPTPANQEVSMTRITGGQFLVTLAYSTINYIYDPQTDSFTENVPCPGNFAGASSLYYDGSDTVYTVTESNWLRKFVISENRWYTLMQAPFDINDSQNISFDGIGSNLYFFYGRNSQGYTALKYSIADNRFYPLTPPSLETTSGDYVVSDQNRYIYIFHNSIDSARQDNFFVKYDTETGRYTPDLYNPQKGYFFDGGSGYYTTPPAFATEDSWEFTSSDWSSGTFDGNDSIYYKSYNYLIQYSVSQQKMIREGRLSVPDYGSIVYANGYIYYARSSTTKGFYRMNVNTWEWQELTQAPGNIYALTSNNMVADGQGRIYVAAGNNSKSVYRYTPGTSTWDTLTAAPVAINSGLSMTYDGDNGNIYFTFSSSSSAFYAYSTTGNTWSAILANIPDDQPNAGATGTYHAGKIYLLKGGNLKVLAIYDIVGNSWSYGPDAPTEVNRGAILLAPNSTFALLSPGGNKAAVWRYNFAGSGVDSNAYGVYTSKNFLIPGIFDYVNITATVNQPAGTSIEFQTRTTDDGQTWTNWQDTTQVKTIGNQIVSQINSPVKKNIQVKAILQSFDSYAIPTLQNFTINVYADTSPPNNPTTVKFYTDGSKNSELTNNTWYNDVTPFIDWPDPGQSGGATDGNIGSNIKGYYVYLGSDNTAVPQTAGVLVTDSQYQPTLTTPGLYYLRMQAVDGSNNVATDVYGGFLYKFDNQTPDSPSVISVDPSGYTLNNNFSFSWPQVTSQYSGIKEYCYKTAGDSGPYATEQCQPGISIANIPAAYQNGANKIIARSHSFAGNYSVPSEATFYWEDTSVTQSTEVTNLHATAQGASLFTFAWDLPLVYVGNADKMSYYYSINSVPNATNTTRVEGRSVGPFRAATQPGTNVFYVVARDEATDFAHINWSKLASVSFFSSTVAPGIPLNLAVDDISAQAYNRWGLALTWSSPNDVGSGIDHYVVERSTDNYHFDLMSSPTSPSYIDNNVSQGQLYYYRVKAADETNNAGGTSTVVSNTPLGKYLSPPKVTAGPSVSTGSNQATVTWSTERPAIGYVVYGSVHDNLNFSSGSQSEVADHTVALTGLSPNTVYYYELQNFDTNKDYSVGQTFSTLQAFRTLEAPTIQGVQISDITLTSAKITFNSIGVTRINVLYGKTSTYGLSKENDTPSTGTQTVVLTDLDNSSTYHFKIDCKTVNGDDIFSDDYFFATVPYPVIANVRFQPINNNNVGVIVTWTTNVETTTGISYQYGGQIRNSSNGDMVTNHKIEIDNLVDNQDYTVIASGTDIYGNTTNSQPQIWRSGLDTQAPNITSIQTESSVGSDTNLAQIVVTWETDEPATSQVEYDTTAGKYNNKTTADASLEKKHVVVLTNLDPTKIYHVRPASVDRAGNAAYGEDTIVTINQPSRSVVQVILNVFKKVFGWIK